VYLTWLGQVRCTSPGEGTGDLGVPSGTDRNSDAREMFSQSESTSAHEVGFSIPSSDLVAWDLSV